MANPNIPSDTIPPTQLPSYSLATRSVHADDVANETSDVAPALHVSTTYRYPEDPEKLVPESQDSLKARGAGNHVQGDTHVYSRLTAPNSSRLELLLTSLLGAPALTYASGLAAFHALLTHIHPKVVAIGAGYHGCHGTLAIYQKLTNCKIVDLFDEASWAAAGLGKGDMLHLETPVNPTGLAHDITHFAARAHALGAVLTIDATFAPPPLLDPFAWGADYVMHSGTKYFGGHSDMLTGVLAVGKHRPGWEDAYWQLFFERLHLGATVGNMESWLGIRSLRTLELRVVRQSQNATSLVAWLQHHLTREDADEASSSSSAVETRTIRATVASLTHASLQSTAEHPWLAQQMPHGFGPVFSITMRSPAHARRLPSKLQLFHHATSLGGVESLIEWRRMSDDTVAETLLRVSVGVEALDDLRADLLGGLEALVQESEGRD